MTWRLRAWSCCQVVPWRAAILLSVSPARTLYAPDPPTAAGVELGPEPEPPMVST
ncbi:MAG: hypothetical protein ACLGI3_04320 [Actinomycetes bacterium]